MNDTTKLEILKKELFKIALSGDLGCEIGYCLLKGIGEKELVAKIDQYDQVSRKEQAELRMLWGIN